MRRSSTISVSYRFFTWLRWWIFTYFLSHLFALSILWSLILTRLILLTFVNILIICSRTDRFWFFIVFNETISMILMILWSWHHFLMIFIQIRWYFDILKSGYFSHHERFPMFLLFLLWNYAWSIIQDIVSKVLDKFLFVLIIWLSVLKVIYLFLVVCFHIGR